MRSDQVALTLPVMVQPESLLRTIPLDSRTMRSPVLSVYAPATWFRSDAEKNVDDSSSVIGTDATPPRLEMAMDLGAASEIVATSDDAVVVDPEVLSRVADNAVSRCDKAPV